jgi:hypothetical protein
MAFQSLQGHFWSYYEFSWYSSKCLHNFQKIRLHFFELIKDEAALKVRVTHYSEPDYCLS